MYAQTRVCKPGGIWTEQGVDLDPTVNLYSCISLVVAALHQDHQRSLFDPAVQPPQPFDPSGTVAKLILQLIFHLLTGPADRPEGILNQVAFDLKSSTMYASVELLADFPEFVGVVGGGVRGGVCACF